MSEQLSAQEGQVPLLVDLDGSLILSDTLYETLLLVLKSSPWLVFILPFWLLQGKQVLKFQLAKRSTLNVSVLPFHEGVVDFLEREHEVNNRKIILCTGSWIEIAEDVCRLYPWMDSVVATNHDRNLTGENKAEWAVERFGKAGFDYLGNEEKDLHIWRLSRRALVVGDDRLLRQVEKVVDVEKQFLVVPVGLKICLKAIRIHQWAKNALVFVPMIASHQLSVNAFSQSALAFLSLSLCASATYLLNDMFDLEADRQHRVKKNRPLASGLLSIPSGILCGVFLMLAGFSLALLINDFFVLAIVVYVILTVLYSFKLKKLQTVDVIVLASLFTVRVIAGGMAIEVHLSFWLLCFSMFMFLSLALVKRVAELIRVEQDESAKGGEKIKGRGYFAADIVILQSLGGAAGFLAVFVFALYINSEDVREMYRYPEILWLMCPVLGYWIMRVWMLVARNQMNEDPISFAVTDFNSWLACGIMAVVMIAAIVI
jgi:4-hydroxybenzoate polyprenyltransferase